MVYQVNVHEVRANLQKLLDQVKNGEEVVIIHGGQPVARLIPYSSTKRRRVPGLLRDKISGPDILPASVPPPEPRP